MAKKRHYSSTVSEHRDKFNDEWKHDKSSMKMGPYHYDRQTSDPRSLDRSARGETSPMGGYYEGHEGRRKQEMRDAGMIHEDHSAVANLPQHVEYRPYPKPRDYMPEDIDDTIHGIDRQISYDNGKRKEHFYPKKV